ncbi:MAG: hypothetical protein NZ840_12755, partial [Anaerolineales bacterium]|nr:hypothetical protein [Anaerolineales bacterium]MDW8162906.1 hypothetical protein [Anaerolineales bacterium]
ARKGIKTPALLASPANSELGPNPLPPARALRCNSADPLTHQRPSLGGVHLSAARTAKSHVL